MNFKNSISTKPSVSIIIPTYNRAKFLPTAIKSALGQSYPNVEIIVIDDGSTDETKLILEPFKGKLRYLTTDHQGAAHARNVGMKAATGKYIAFLDSDDTYLPYKLELQVAFMEEHPEVGMVCTEFSGASKSGYVEELHMRTYHPIWEQKGWNYEDIFSITGEFSCDAVDMSISYYIGDIFKYALMDTLIPSNTILFPKSLLGTVGYQDVTIRSGQDYDFVVRICKHFQIAFLNIPTYVIFYHGDQLSNRNKYEKYEKKGGILYDITCGEVYLHVITNWAYNDQDYYNKNREFVNLRLAEIYRLMGVKWLEYGDITKAKECFQSGYAFDPCWRKYRKYWWLSLMPSILRNLIIGSAYKLTDWTFRITNRRARRRQFKKLKWPIFKKENRF